MCRNVSSIVAKMHPIWVIYKIAFAPESSGQSWIGRESSGVMPSTERKTGKEKVCEFSSRTECATG